MRKLFVEIFFIAFLFLILVSWLEKRYSSYRTKADLMMDSFFSSAENAEVLLVGNSHAIAVYEQISNLPGDKVSLLALGGLDVFQMRNLTCRFAGRMKHLKLIIICADEYCFGNNLKLLNFSYVDRMLYPYTDTLYEKSLSAKISARSNFLRSNRDLSYLFSHNDNSANGKENAVDNRPNPLANINCADRAIELTEKRFQKKLYLENNKLFGELLDGALKTKAAVVVVSLPKSPCYNTYKNTEHTMEGDSMLRAFALKKNVLYYNLAYVDSMGESNFRDADHMNKKGVMAFISIMDELLRKDSVVADFGSMISETQRQRDVPKMQTQISLNFASKEDVK